MPGVRVPSGTPFEFLGISQVGKAHDFDSCMRRFESCIPSHYDLLAQSAEHLTFNQGVPRSSRGWVTILERYRSGHNEAVLKTVWVKAHVGSNPTLSAKFNILVEKYSRG